MTSRFEASADCEASLDMQPSRNLKPSARWLIPPFSDEGDQREDEIFKAVGYALNEWEHYELRLGVLYGMFLNLEPDEAVGTEEYSKASSIEGRLTAIERAAAKFFAPRCDQHMEGLLLRLLVEAREASRRRNDIAHGIVYLKLGPNRHPNGWELLPTLYTIKKYTNGVPRYRYRAFHVKDFGEKFLDLRFETNAYLDLLEAHLLS